jgi:hypothetical protein
MATEQILLETYLHGSPILSYVHAPLEQRQELARLGCATVLKMFFVNDFVKPRRLASGQHFGGGYGQVPQTSSLGLWLGD